MEDLQKQILELQDQLKAMNDTIAAKDELLEGFKTKEAQHLEQASKYQEQILRLRDMNTDLFLRVSQPIPNEVVEEKPTVSQEESIRLEDILG